MAAAALLAACGSGDSSAVGSSEVPSSSLGPHRARLAVVGDIACASPTAIGDRCHQAATYKIAAAIKPDRALILGDTQYPNGALRLYRQSYARSWGKLGAKAFPVPGNHEYETAGAAGYFDYFGALAGRRGKGWRATTIGGWRVIGLNSNCSQVGGCGVGSPQSNWLKAELATNKTACTLALSHYPRFSSGPHGDNAVMSNFWSQLQDAKAEVVFAGHDHDYERLAPLSDSGQPSSAGMASFVVGSGGVKRYLDFKARSGTAAHSLQYGVLQLDLYERGYSWKFIETNGSVSDSGRAACR